MSQPVKKSQHMAITIEKNIPIAQCRVQISGYISMKKHLRLLTIGDSFVIPKSGQSHVHTRADEIGIRVCTRTISKNSIRVWRVA